MASSSSTTTLTTTESCITALLFLISSHLISFDRFSSVFSTFFLTVVVNNWLEKRIPQPQQQNMPNDKYKHVDEQLKNKQQYRYQRSKLIRRAFIGFCSSFASDCISNGIRVVKVYKQTSDIPLSYLDAVAALFDESGLFFLIRGLGLKLISNGLSGILFSVLWKMIMDRMNNSATAVGEATTTKSK